MHIAIRAFSDAPVETVFAAAADLTGWPGFIARVVRVDILTEGPIGIGTKLLLARRTLGRETSEELTVADFDPPHALAFTSETGGARYEMNFIFAATGSETAISLLFAEEPLTLKAKLLEPVGLLLAAKLEGEFEADVADLAAEAERRAGIKAEPLLE